MRVAGVLRPQRSVAKDLMKIFDDDRLMLAMSFQTKYLGMSPFNCPSLFTMLAFLEYEYGIFHPMGGLGSVSERMGQIARDMGVEFRMGEAVTEVIMDKKTIKGVVTENGEFYADKVVMNADFAQGMTSLFSTMSERSGQTRKLTTRSIHVQHLCLFSTELMMITTPPNLRFKGLRFKLRRHRKHHRLTWDDPRQNACVTDPQMAPDGCSTVYALVPVSDP